MATNAEWMVKNGYEFSSLHALPADKGKHGYDICIRTEKGRFVKLGEVDTVFNNSATAVFLWLDQEHVEPILDEVEKRYLKGVIGPFRGRAVFVKKIYHTGYTVDYEQIIIRVKSIATLIADIPLPFFKKGEMYKGMKLNREYTLEELGL